MKQYKLLGPDGNFYYSETKGTWGGYNGKIKIYGTMNCRSALSWIEKGHYIDKRVFFKDEKDAILAGFRPCAICQPEKYLKWKENPEKFKKDILSQKDNQIERV